MLRRAPARMTGWRPEHDQSPPIGGKWRAAPGDDENYVFAIAL